MSDAQRAGLAGRVLKALAPPLLLILSVLGSILAGIATPTESASVGAVGAMLLSAANRSFSLPILREVMRTTLTISSMVFVILLGASVFSLVFRGLGGENLVHDALSSLPGGTFTAVLAVMLVIFFLGFFLDTFEIIFVVVPIAAPALIKMGVDPVWLGVMIGVNLQTSFLTPPFGFALFYLRGVAGRMLTTLDIYKGVVPFVALQVRRPRPALGGAGTGDLPAGPAVRAGGAAAGGHARPERPDDAVRLAGGGRFQRPVRRTPRRTRPRPYQDDLRGPVSAGRRRREEQGARRR